MPSVAPTRLPALAVPVAMPTTTSSTPTASSPTLLLLMAVRTLISPTTHPPPLPASSPPSTTPRITGATPETPPTRASPPATPTPTTSARPPVPPRSRSSPMQAPLSSPRPLLPSTVGARTQSSPPSSSSTARIASRSVRDPTLTLSSPSSPTLAHPTPASTCTRSLSGLRSISLPAHATSRALTMPPFSSFSPTPQWRVHPLLRSVSMPQIIMSSELCPAWVGLRIQISDREGCDQHLYCDQQIKSFCMILF